MVLDFVKDVFLANNKIRIKELNSCLDPSKWTKEMVDAFWLGFGLGAGSK